MKKYTKGFTLVELLIVIALLGVIALIVIAAINPIEQANRSRDTKMKADGGQLLSAIERYFAANYEFPWVVDPATSTLTNDDAFGFVSAATPGVGICLAADCSTDGALLSGLELKPEFKNRDFVTTTVETDKLYVGKELSASSSVYVCYIPNSRSFRQNGCDNDNVYTISTSDGSRTKVSAASCDPDNWVVNVGAGTAQFLCIPE